jgi:hypothetical protein
LSQQGLIVNLYSLASIRLETSLLVPIRAASKVAYAAELRLLQDERKIKVKEARVQIQNVTEAILEEVITCCLNPFHAFEVTADCYLVIKGRIEGMREVERIKMTLLEEARNRADAEAKASLEKQKQMLQVSFEKEKKIVMERARQEAEAVIR